MDDIDRLAIGFADSANRQHMQGIDLNGEAGKPLFATDSLKAVAAPLNTGEASLSLRILSAAQLTGATYAARYDAAKATWTLSSSEGATITGANDLQLDGVRFRFDGAAQDGDAFTVAPLATAAASMRYLRTSSDEIAAGMALYVDPAAANTGSAKAAIADAQADIPATPLPSAARLFGGAGSSGVDFLRDGSAFFLPAGSASASLVSLGRLPSLRFDASASEMASLSQAGANGGLSLVATLDLGAANQVNLTLDLAPRGATLADMAASINEAARHAGKADALFASVSDGKLVVVGLGGHDLGAGALKGATAHGAAASIAAKVEQEAPAADMRVFTRDGRQLSGPPLTAAQAAAYVTAANGFLAEAVYAPPSQTAGYRGLALADASQPLEASASSATSARLVVHADPAFADIQAADGASRLPGAIYALDVQGLPALRVASSEIEATSESDVAAALAQRLDALATRRAYAGHAIDLASTQADTLTFSVTIDGAVQQVAFTRGRDAQGALTATGAFQVTGDAGLTIALAPDGAGGSRVILSLPLHLSTAVPNLSISADAATGAALGLDAAPGAMLTAGQDLAASLLASRKPVLHVQGGAAGDLSLTIDGTNGRVGAVSWSLVDGKLRLASSDPTLHVVTSSASDLAAAQALGFSGSESAGGVIEASQPLANSLLGAQGVTLSLAGGVSLAIGATSGQSQGVSWSLVNGRLALSGGNALAFATTTRQARDGAASLGFLGTDLDLAREGAALTLTSQASDSTGALADDSASVSAAATRLTIGSALPEDLIVSVANAQPNGARRIAAAIGAASGGVDTPNFKVKILSADRLEIVDDATGLSLANRTWKSDAPVTYLGVSFTVSGAAKAGDIFRIAQDRTRTGDNRNALALAALAKASVFGPKQGSFHDVYTSVAGDFGSTVAAAKENAVATKQRASDLKAAYEAKTGVNLDSEAADLIRFQQAYQAAAQIVSSARDMFQTILKSF